METERRWGKNPRNSGSQIAQEVEYHGQGEREMGKWDDGSTAFFPGQEQLKKTPI